MNPLIPAIRPALARSIPAIVLYIGQMPVKKSNTKWLVTRIGRCFFTRVEDLKKENIKLIQWVVFNYIIRKFGIKFFKKN